MEFHSSFSRKHHGSKGAFFSAWPLSDIAAYKRVGGIVRWADELCGCRLNRGIAKLPTNGRFAIKANIEVMQR